MAKWLAMDRASKDADAFEDYNLQKHSLGEDAARPS
jgi:hypothetical protein